MKFCKKCQTNKELDQFCRDKTAKDGLNFKCKECVIKYYIQNKEKKLKYDKEYREKNPNFQKEYRLNNKSKIRKNYRDNLQNRLEYAKNYNKLNPNYKKEYSNKRYKNDILFRLKAIIRSNIRFGFKSNNLNKSSNTEHILGCTFEQFKQYIESQFESWMNWENQGGQIITKINESWDLDHKIPISTAKTKEDVLKLSHYTNFQPLCSYYNRFIKRNNYENKNEN